MQRICEAVSDATRRSQTQRSIETLVAALNRQLIGWASYFCLGPVSKAYRAVEHHTRRRLRQWLRIKHKCQNSGTNQYPDEALHDKFGLVRLTARTASRGRPREPFSESRMRTHGLGGGRWPASRQLDAPPPTRRTRRPKSTSAIMPFYQASECNLRQIHLPKSGGFIDLSSAQT